MYKYTNFQKAREDYRNNLAGVEAMDEAIAYMRETHFIECVSDALKYLDIKFILAAKISLSYAANHLAKDDVETRTAELQIIAEFKAEHAFVNWDYDPLDESI